MLKFIKIYLLICYKVIHCKNFKNRYQLIEYARVRHTNEPAKGLQTYTENKFDGKIGDYPHLVVKSFLV